MEKVQGGRSSPQPFFLDSIPRAHVKGPASRDPSGGPSLPSATPLLSRKRFRGFRPQGKEAMIVFEYLTLLVRQGFGNPDMRDVNKLAAQGWRLVSTCCTGTADTIFYTFERPKSK